MSAILQINGVSKSFGGIIANQRITLSVANKQITGLIGPNGSGKTTLFNSICGTHPIDEGSINFNGKEVSTLPIPAVAKLGLLRTFQQTHIYGKLNCIQNMLISAKPKSDNLFSIFSKIPLDLNNEAEHLLEFVGLYQKRFLRAGDLSFGQQKLLELAMALMNKPKMLLLDEPTAGVASFNVSPASFGKYLTIDIWEYCLEFPRRKPSIIIKKLKHKVGLGSKM